MKQVFTNVYPEFSLKTKIFPNIILPDEIRANAKGKGFDDGFTGFRLLTVGRLHPQKGYDIAIPAFAKLIGMGYSNIRWYVLGDGNERRRLERLITKLGLDGKFVLLGSRPNPLPYVAEADIYVQPSRFEGFPLTLQEALVLGKPCLTTNFEGVSDLLESGKNAMIITLSIDNIVKVLAELIDNEELRNRIADGVSNLDFDFPDKTAVFYEVLNGNGWKED